MIWDTNQLLLLDMGYLISINHSVLTHDYYWEY